jgi:hypothetical protein
MMLLECFPGETIRLSANDLTHTDSGAVTTGATVTISLYNPDESLNSTQSGDNGGSGDDWYYDFTAPATPGEYQFKITAEKSGATAKGKDSIRVKAF